MELNTASRSRSAWGSERRSAPRVSASELPPLTLRVRPGATVLSVLNVSRDGALVESARRLMPGSVLTLQFVSAAGSALMRASVCRCVVSGLDPVRGVRYRGAVCFAEPFDFSIF